MTTSCSAPDCDRVSLARKLCGGHYAQQRKGRPLTPLQFRRVGPCLVDGCPERVWARRYCRRHYRRAHSSGGLDGPTRRPQGTGSIDKKSGYITITIGGIRYLQHRYVMAQMLGRPLLPEENVHHRNGIRSDNRRSNLELWVKSQPSGQRPEDLVAFVLRYYPDLVRSQLKGAIS